MCTHGQYFQVRVAEGRTKDPPAESLAKLQKSGIPGTKSILEVKYLGEWRYHILAGSRKAKEILQENVDWVKALGDKAFMAREATVLLVNGIPTYSKNTPTEELTPAGVMNQNRGLHPNLEVTKTWWKNASKVIREKKRYTTLMMRVKDRKQAEGILERGIYLGGAHKRAVIWEKDMEVVICYKCGGTGHVAPHCTREIRCEGCNGTHETRACKEGKQPTCRNCHRVGHMASSYDCPMLEKKLRAAEYRRIRAGAQVATPKPWQPVDRRAQPTTKEAPTTPNNVDTTQTTQKESNQGQAQTIDPASQARTPEAQKPTRVQTQGEQQQTQIGDGTATSPTTEGNTEEGRAPKRTRQGEVIERTPEPCKKPGPGRPKALLAAAVGTRDIREYSSPSSSGPATTGMEVCLPDIDPQVGEPIEMDTTPENTQPNAGTEL